MHHVDNDHGEPVRPGRRDLPVPGHHHRCGGERLHHRHPDGHHRHHRPHCWHAVADRLRRHGREHHRRPVERQHLRSRRLGRRAGHDRQLRVLHRHWRDLDRHDGQPVGPRRWQLPVPRRRHRCGGERLDHRGPVRDHRQHGAVPACDRPRCGLGPRRVGHRQQDLRPDAELHHHGGNGATVEVFLNGVSAGFATETAPGQFAFISVALAKGAIIYQFTAIATDAAGNASTASPCSMYLSPSRMSTPAP